MALRAPRLQWLTRSSPLNLAASSSTPSTCSATALLPLRTQSSSRIPPVPSSSVSSSTTSISKTTTRGIKSIHAPRPSRFAAPSNSNLPILTSTTAHSLLRKRTLPLRTGALALKKGMTALYDAETGVRTPATILQLDRNVVTALKTRERHGYWAVQIGAGERVAKRVGRAMLGHFEGAGVAPKKWVREFRVRDGKGVNALRVGMEIGPGWFSLGQFVDVRAKCRGMGFAGGMKRHGFGGQPASHGQSLTHRALGSAGASQGSGSRVHPGKRMAGRMGGQRVTVQNLKVMLVDEANGLVVVNGAVSGPKNGLVMLQDALKKPPPVVSPVTDAAAAATAGATA